MRIHTKLVIYNIDALYTVRLYLGIYTWSFHWYFIHGNAKPSNIFDNSHVGIVPSILGKNERWLAVESMTKFLSHLGLVNCVSQSRCSLRYLNPVPQVMIKRNSFYLVSITSSTLCMFNLSFLRKHFSNL